MVRQYKKKTKTSLSTDIDDILPSNGKYNPPFEFTSKQKNVKTAFSKNHIILDGSAGTGKTYIALYLSLLALQEKKFEKIIIVRSPQQTVEVGFLPGGIDFSTDGAKLAPFLIPYENIVNEIAGKGFWFSNFGKRIIFEPGVAIRGLTFDNAIVFVDEAQNFNFHALDSIITRLGKNSKFIMAGDYYQSDLKKTHDKSGFSDFLNILDKVDYFTRFSFTHKDIVRSELVKSYIIEKENYQKPN